MNLFTSTCLFFFCLRVQDEQDLEEYEDEFAEMADEDYSEFVEEQNETAELDEEKEELKEEAEETEEEINDGDYSSSNGADDVYDYYEEEAAWYWDEYPSSYDDEIYDDGYWVRLKDLVQRFDEIY